MIWIVSFGLLAIGGLTLHFWRQGAVGAAEQPQSLTDRTVLDPRERKAFLKRLIRWKEEGKITREEYERLLDLCETEW